MRRELAELITIHHQLSTITSSGAVVLLIGFWFDGGMFKLPTAVVFWVLVEVARIFPRPLRWEENSPKRNFAHGPPEPTLSPSQEGNDFAKTCCRAPLLGGAGGGSVQVAGLGLTGGATEPGVGKPRELAGWKTCPTKTGPTVMALRWSAGLASVLAVALTAIHVITPQLAVSERTLALARQFLVPSRENDDFAYLSAQPIWSGQPLKVLLQHTHLANYNGTLVNWQLEDQLYREFVLSPEIVLPKLPAPGLATTLALSDGEREGVRGIATPTNHPSTIHSQRSTDLNWRRELWEYFYPRIRRERILGAAAEIVLREVQEKIAVTEAPNPETILEMWQQGRASAAGRARLQVAAWRAVGIPARLNQSDHAEFWNGTAWVE